MSDAKRLSFNTRKSLSVHINETAGAELVETIEYLLARIEQLEKSKVDVTPIVPHSIPIDSRSRRAA